MGGPGGASSVKLGGGWVGGNVVEWVSWRGEVKVRAGYIGM